MTAPTHAPPTHDRPILSIRDLYTQFPVRNGLVKAVDGVSFDLARGKTVCVVGESGSGKSVTARSILQIVDPPGRVIGGSIVFNRDDGSSVDLTALDPRSREIRSVRGREIAMIFQEPMSSLSPVHTIGNQITEVLRLHLKMSKAEATERAIDLLRAVEIPNPERAIERYTFEYSGGMRQRAMIAMALACNPAVLIADEPTTALDVTTQAEILDLMRRLRADRGMAVMFITHDMGVVAEIADEVVVMYQGKVVERGPVEQMFHAPEQPYTKMLLGNVLKLEQPSAIRAARAPIAADAPPLLEARGLKMHFPIRKGFFKKIVDHVRAVDDVDIVVRAGETLGIVGESGSGKTTLGRCLLRVYEPTAGQILYRRPDGSVIDVASAGPEALKQCRREMRMIFQDPFASLNPRMTVGQIIGEPLLVNGLAQGSVLHDRVAALLTRVGLNPDWAERYPHAFSGGQRQRIGIARALAP